MIKLIIKMNIADKDNRANKVDTSPKRLVRKLLSDLSSYQLYYLPFIIIFIISIISIRPARASLYEDEVKISGDVQNRLQKELENVLGKNRVSALVRIELTLEPGLREAIRDAFLNVPRSRTVSQPKDDEFTLSNSTDYAKAENPEFSWKGGKSEPGSFVLPGFAAKKKVSQSESGGSNSGSVSPSSKIDPSLVLAAGTVIKQIYVKISIDEKLPATAEEVASSIVNNFLRPSISRGDVLNIERVSVPSPWESFLRDPEMLSQVIQRSLMVLGVVFVGFLIVIGLWMFAGTIRRSTDRIAGVIATGMRDRNVDMDIKYKSLGGAPIPGLPGTSDIPAGEGGMMSPSSDYPAIGTESGIPASVRGRRSQFVIDVGLDQVGKLFHLLHRENPDNIALILPHLDSDVKRAFLALLPKPVAAEVLSSLSAIRFLDPEVILRMKSEMERRIQGAVGGVEQVIELIQNADGKTKRDLMEILKQRNPTLAQEVRGKILFFEDILKINDAEIQQLLSVVKADDLSLALAKSPEEMVQKIKTGLSKKMQEILQQMMTFRAQPPEEKILEAQDKMIAVLSRLIQDGRIRNPLLKTVEETKLLESSSNPAS